MKKIILAFSFIAVGACSHLEKLPVASSDEAVQKKILEAHPQAPFVKGEDCGQMFFIFPAGVPRQDQAYNKTLRQAPGTNAIVDAKVTNTFFMIPLLYMKACFQIEGRAVKL